MRRSKVIHAGTILAMLLSTYAHAIPSQPTAQDIARRVEEHYKHARTLRALFLERYSDGPHDAHIESGTVYFERPGRMHWDYDSPETQQFVSDGKTIWFYVPADHTVTRMPVRESTDWRTPLALLTGKADLSKLCGKIDLDPKAPADRGNIVLRCLPRGEKIPKPKAEPQNQAELPGAVDFTEVKIEVNRESGQLANVEIQQPGGIALEYRFGNWQENTDLPETLFHFAAPAGVAIVNGAALNGSTP